MSSWHQGKLFVEHLLTISHDTLHLIVGLLVWLAIGLLGYRTLEDHRPIPRRYNIAGLADVRNGSKTDIAE